MKPFFLEKVALQLLYLIKKFSYVYNWLPLLKRGGFALEENFAITSS